MGVAYVCSLRRTPIDVVDLTVSRYGRAPFAEWLDYLAASQRAPQQVKFVHFFESHFLQRESIGSLFFPTDANVQPHEMP